MLVHALVTSCIDFCKALFLDSRKNIMPMEEAVQPVVGGPGDGGGTLFLTDQ